MATPLDLLPGLDAAAKPFVAALVASGPVYLKSDDDWIWLLQASPREFLGFSAIAVPPATLFQPFAKTAPPEPSNSSDPSSHPSP